jgi:hypothetical protein
MPAGEYETHFLLLLSRRCYGRRTGLVVETPWHRVQGSKTTISNQYLGTWDKRAWPRRVSGDLGRNKVLTGVTGGFETLSP